MLVAFFVGDLTNFSHSIQLGMPVFRLAPGFLAVVLKGQFPDQPCGEVRTHAGRDLGFSLLLLSAGFLVDVCVHAQLGLFLRLQA